MKNDCKLEREKDFFTPNPKEMIVNRFRGKEVTLAYV
jgi:hypothetical protein